MIDFLFQIKLAVPVWICKVDGSMSGMFHTAHTNRTSVTPFAPNDAVSIDSTLSAFLVLATCASTFD